MIAWISRIVLLVQAAAVGGLYLFFTQTLDVQNSVLAMLFSIAVLIVVRLVIVANNFLLAARYRSPLPAHCRLGWRRALALFFLEAKATLTASSWDMPFRKFRKRPASTSQELPVLLVHGYGCNSGYWQPLSKTLQQAQITHYAVDMEPVFGGIDEYVPHVHEAIEELCRDTGNDQVVIVAHSMGGLATRAYLRDHGSSRVARVITLGTPHHGTALAQFGVGINTQQMHWTLSEQEGLCSNWLRQLAHVEGPDAYRIFVSIYSHHDNIISPQTSSHLPGAKNIELYGIGHVALVPDPTVQSLVTNEIRAASRTEVEPARISVDSAL